MNIEPRLLKPHFHPYYHDQGVLIQFILTDFLYALKEMRTVSRHLEAFRSLNISREAIYDLRVSFSRLLGTSGEFMCQLPWNPEMGVFLKLKIYASQFAQNVSEDNHDIHAVHDYFHKSCLSCKQVIDTLYSINEDSIQEEYVYSSSKLRYIIDKINRSMRRCARLIVQILYSFRRNENVVFFLLRHYQQISALYGPRLLFKIFRKMSPEGIEDLKNHLLTRYERRGFDHLLQPIKQMFLTIER